MTTGPDFSVNTKQTLGKELVRSVQTRIAEMRQADHILTKTKPLTSEKQPTLEELVKVPPGMTPG